MGDSQREQRNMETTSKMPGGEPCVDEMLEDAVVKAVMQRDGVGRGELLGLIEWARIELGKRRRQTAIAAMRIGRAA
jgi:hypothetical protein